MSTEDSVLEGFLCPICKIDLKSTSQLWSHFENEHSEDQDLIKSFKGLVGRAKNKILNIDEKDLESFKNVVRIKSRRQECREVEVQEIGVSRSHTAFYKSVRGTRLEHFQAETNKLLIRLDKLLSIDSTDRRNHEQAVVQWLDGSSVKLCPFCVKSFNITRRQHHCRLCGSILCNSCSHNLNLAKARSMTGILSQTKEHPLETEEYSLRVCEHCLSLLETRYSLQQKRLTQAPASTLYTELRSLLSQTVTSVLLYEKMHDSLTNGISTYSLPDAQTLRSAIAKQGEQMDIISKKIIALPGNPRELKLYDAIRRSVTMYLKDKLSCLPQLPTADELRKTPTKTLQDSSSLHVQDIPVIVSGWSPTVHPAPVVDPRGTDPLVVQMDVIRGYITEARKVLRFEEVALLEKNLRELQNEYFLRQEANKQ